MPPKKTGAYKHAADVARGSVLIDGRKRRYVFADVIGRGGFGVVYAAKVCHRAVFYHVSYAFAPYAVRGRS